MFLQCIKHQLKLLNALSYLYLCVESNQCVYTHHFNKSKANIQENIKGLLCLTVQEMFRMMCEGLFGLKIYKKISL